MKVMDLLRAEENIFHESYQRIVSLQAWRANVVESVMSAESAAFFLEAQNDALISHVLAQMGSWRSALKSLRSCIENVLFTLYYMDHPVELILWQQGKIRHTFNEMHRYFLAHPRVTSASKRATGLEILQKEYSLLSRAVHASARTFRMTQDVQATQLWSPEKTRIGSWRTRESLVLQGLNLLMMVLFRDSLTGSKLVGLRRAISLAIPPSMYAVIKRDLKITLLRA